MLAFISSFCWNGNDAIFVIFSVASESPCGLAVLVLLRSLDSSCLILRVCLLDDVETLSENIGPSNRITWGSVSIDQFSGEQFCLALSRCLSLSISARHFYDQALGMSRRGARFTAGKPSDMLGETAISSLR